MKAKRARHKTGRGKIPISFSIPRSQIDWLDQHPELNQSHLVSTLLAAHIEAFEAVKPEKIKLILKLRTLKYEFENTGIELEKSRTEYVNVKGLYDDELRELRIFDAVRSYVCALYAAANCR